MVGYTDAAIPGRWEDFRAKARAAGDGWPPAFDHLPQHPWRSSSKPCARFCEDHPRLRRPGLSETAPTSTPWWASPNPARSAAHVSPPEPARRPSAFPMAVAARAWGPIGAKRASWPICRPTRPAATKARVSGRALCAHPVPPLGPRSCRSPGPISLMTGGARGLTQATKVAILNANYIAKRLEGAYDVLLQGLRTALSPI